MQLYKNNVINIQMKNNLKPRKLPVYALEIDENDISKTGLKATSYVDIPAIMTNFIYMNEKENSYKFNSDVEKRIVMGPIMIPDQLIYRKNDNMEYYVYFTADQIEKTLDKYMRLGNLNENTLQHEIKIEGNYLREIWIVEDPKCDKSTKFGYELPKGTLMQSFKITDDNTWDNYIKTGIVKGFSLEGYFNEVLQPFEISMKSQEIKKINLTMQSEFKVGDLTITIDDRGFVMTAEGNKMPEGEYKSDDGYTICVNELGQYTSIMSPNAIMEDMGDGYMMSKNKKVSFKSILEAIGFGFNHQTEVIMAPSPAIVDKIKTIDITLADGNVLSIPTDGSKIEGVDKDGNKYEITAVPVTIPMTSPAETGASVANPLNEVPQTINNDAILSNMKAEITRLENMLNMSAVPVVQMAEDFQSKSTNSSAEIISKMNEFKKAKKK